MLTLLLIRYAVVAGALVVVGLGVFAVAVRLKRRGRMDQVRRSVEPLTRAAARHLTDPAAPHTGTSRSELAGTAIRAATRYLDDRRGGNRR
ncbi:hypothetical protein [Nocardia terpenica]|uniref:hypothetical protein n=1 Tax=Nocardia terpenica TaxID=455432 RepID=UPI00158420C2|nr:hypothetical protein [Nocardia terpenica]